MTWRIPTTRASALAISPWPWRETGSNSGSRSDISMPRAGKYGAGCRPASCAMPAESLYFISHVLDVTQSRCDSGPALLTCPDSGEFVAARRMREEDLDELGTYALSRAVGKLTGSHSGLLAMVDPGQNAFQVLASHPSGFEAFGLPPDQATVGFDAVRLWLKPGRRPARWWPTIRRSPPATLPGKIRRHGAAGSWSRFATTWKPSCSWPCWQGRIL